jgi:hypothetical protein
MEAKEICHIATSLATIGRLRPRIRINVASVTRELKRGMILSE